MEYERCSPSTPTIVIAVAMLLLILVVYFLLMKREHAGDRVDQVITALNVTQQEKGTIVDFKGYLKDQSFSPLKYMHLTDLYRQGKVTKESVSKVLSDANL